MKALRNRTWHLHSPHKISSELVDRKRLLGRFLRASRLDSAFIQTFNKRRVGIIVYHDPDPTEFAKSIAYIKRHCSLISLSQLVESLNSRRWDALPDRAIVITIDDGHRGNYELAETLRSLEAPVTIYLTSQVIDTNRRFWWTVTEDPEALKSVPNADRLARLRDMGFIQEEEVVGMERQALSGDEIRALSDAVEFGAHTRFHPILPMCDDQTAREEIVSGRLEVSEISGQPCQHFAYPNGDACERDEVLVREGGYSSARTIEAGWVDSSADRFRLPVISVDEILVDRLVVDLAGLGAVKRATARKLRGTRRL